MSVCVARHGSAWATPPIAVRTGRTLLASLRNAHGHWKPTGAEIMHSGQIGREHRAQRCASHGSGCR
jgi:hypothetical protein